MAHSKSRPGKRTWRCPDETQLGAYLDGRLDSDPRRRIEEHVADCPFCLDQVAFLVRLESSEMPGEVPAALLARAREFAPVQSGARRAFAYRWGVLAAVTACLAVAINFWRQAPEMAPVPAGPSAGPPAQVVAPSPSPPAPAPPPQAPRAVRKEHRAGVLPELLFPGEGAVLGVREIEFRWKPVRRSLFYEIRVVTAEGDLVWEGRAERTQTRLPPGVQLMRGQTYFVWVRAYLPEGKTLQSKAVAFRARAAGS